MIKINLGRRPLCVVLLFFLAVWTALLGKQPDTARKEGQEAFTKRRARVMGTVAALYEPADGSLEGKVVSLKQVTILTDSIVNHSLDQIDSKERTEENNKITGVVCYLKEEETLPHIGAQVIVDGQLRPFREATNPGEFDARDWYRRQGYGLQLTGATLCKEGKAYDRIGWLLYCVRRRIARIYYLLLGDKDGGLAAAMVLGQKKELGTGIKNLYQNAGLSHLLAISGLHIGLLGGSLFALQKRVGMPAPAAAGLSAVFVLGYGSMVGAGFSTRRAVIMFLLTTAAFVFHRTPDLPTSLTLAATGILVWSPQALEEAGLQLSFSAVAGIAFMTPVLKEEGFGDTGLYTKRKKIGKRIRESFHAGLGATLFMLPFLLAHFYTWNPWSLAVNLPALCLMGFLLPALLCLAGSSLLWEGICALVGSGGLAAGIPFWLRVIVWPVKFVFMIYEKLCIFAGSLPGSCLHIGVPKYWQLTLYGISLAALLIWGRRLRARWRILWALALPFLFWVRLPGDLTVTMLDVGQGECILVETPRQGAILLDAGASDRHNVGSYQIVPCLKYCGVRRLEAVFVSHWDEDHINALEEVFCWGRQENVKIGKLVLPAVSLEDEALRDLLDLAAEYEIGVERIGAGTVWKLGALSVTCLHPYQDEVVWERNDASAVLRLDYGDFRALFMGDLEAEGEAWLAERYKEQELSCDLLAVGHHGSDTSSTLAFLQAAHPAVALISCGENNRYGHPSKEVLERMEGLNIHVYVTAQRGAIRVRVHKKGIGVVCWR